MKAIVLAAGFGKRLRPLTEHLPKTLVPVLGVPAIEHVLNHLIQYDVKDVGINVHYQSELFFSYFQSVYRKNLDVRIVREEKILGTGGAVFNFRKFLQGSDPFWIHNGDIISDIDLISALSTHQKKRALATLILWDYPPINTVLLDQYGNVMDLSSKFHVQEKNGGTYEKGGFMTYTGIAVLDPKIFDYIPSGYSEMPEVYQNIINIHGPGKICGVKGEGRYWADFGTFSRYLDLHQYLLLHQRGNPIDRSSPNVSIHRGGECITISKSTDLKGFISIGNNCVIEDDVFLKDCVLWPGTKVPSGTHVQRGVLSKDFIFQESDEKTKGEIENQGL